MNQIQSIQPIPVLSEQDIQQIMRCQSGADRLQSELGALFAVQNPLLSELALRELSIVSEVRYRLDRLAELVRSGA